MVGSLGGDIWCVSEHMIGAHSKVTREDHKVGLRFTDVETHRRVPSKITWSRSRVVWTYSRIR